MYEVLAAKGYPGMNVAQPARREEVFGGEERAFEIRCLLCEGYVESHSFCNLKFELPDKAILASVRILRAKLSERKRVVSGVEDF